MKLMNQDMGYYKYKRELKSPVEAGNNPYRKNARELKEIAESHQRFKD